MRTDDVHSPRIDPAVDIAEQAGKMRGAETLAGEKAEFWAAAPVKPLRCAAGASLVAGVLHYAAVPSHREEWWLAAAFFTVLAAFQIIWAALVWCDDGRPVLWWGGLVNAGTAGLWVMTRSIGLPFGPQAGIPEDIGALDVASTLAELVILVAVLLVLAHRQNGFRTAR